MQNRRFLCLLPLLRHPLHLLLPHIVLRVITIKKKRQVAIKRTKLRQKEKDVQNLAVEAESKEIGRLYLKKKPQLFPKEAMIYDQLIIQKFLMNLNKYY